MPVVGFNGIYFSGRLEPRGPVYIFRMDDSAGTVSSPLASFEADRFDYVMLSLAGTTLLAVNSNGSVSAIDIRNDVLIDTFTLPEMEDDGGYPVDSALIWNELPLLVTANGAIIVLGAEG
jgi:hypothetical protein